MASSPYRISPPLLARYPWINKADTKFNDDGIFKFDGIAEGEIAQSLKASIDKAAEDAFEEGTKDLTPADKKKWSLYLPYQVEEDDNGNPTGRIIFQFRQNAVLKVEGERKAIQIAIFDSKDKPTAVKIFGGAILRASYKMRPIKLATSKQWGVRLDFLKVQVVKLSDRTADGGGFGSVEGGYVEEHGEGGFTEPKPDGGSAASADY